MRTSLCLALLCATLGCSPQPEANLPPQKSRVPGNVIRTNRVEAANEQPSPNPDPNPLSETSVDQLRRLYVEYGINERYAPQSEQTAAEALKHLKLSLEKSKASVHPEPAEYEFSHLALLDVQGLFGGQNVFIKGDGAAVVEVIGDEGPPGGTLPKGKHFWCYRYDTRVSDSELKELQDCLKSSKHMSMLLPLRMGIPDEASPAIYVRLNDGTSRHVFAWEGDRHPAFRAEYEALLDLVAKTSELKKPEPVAWGGNDWMTYPFDFGDVLK